MPRTAPDRNTAIVTTAKCHGVTHLTSRRISGFGDRDGPVFHRAEADRAGVVASGAFAGLRADARCDRVDFGALFLVRAVGREYQHVAQRGARTSGWSCRN